MEIKPNELESIQAYNPQHKDCPICNGEEDFSDFLYEQQRDNKRMDEELETMDDCIDGIKSILKRLKERTK